MNSGGFVSGKIQQYGIVKPFAEYRFLEPDELVIVPEGFSWDGLKQFSFQSLLAAGFTVFDVRHECSTDTKLDEIVGDIRRAVRFVKYHADDFRIDPDRIGLWGASSGGYLAVFVGVTAQDGDAGSEDPVERSDTRVQAIAAYYPAGFDWVPDSKRFPDVFETLSALHMDSVALDTLSVKNHISKDDPPVFVIYGEEDFPFITEPSEAVCAELTKVGVETALIRIPGTGHEFSGQEGYHAQHGERANTEMVAWFAKHLGRK
jgi:dipeptidyl aminopeptidase/acylaminoacyl peptidase